MTYLLRHPKSHVYFLRRVVPPALRETVGRREIRRSLRTRDLAEAKRRLVAAAAEVDRMFAEAERHQAEGAPLSITLEDARNWVEDWLKRELKKIEAHAATRGRRPIERILREIRGCEETEDAYKIQLACNRPDGLLLPISEVLEGRPITLSPDGPEAALLAKALAPAWLRWVSALRESYRDELGVSEERLNRLWPVAGLEPFVPMAPDLSEPAETDSEETTLSQAFEKYAAEANLRPQTLAEFTTALRRFREVVGGDPPVRTIGKAHVRQWKEALLRMPRRLSIEDRRLPLPEIVVRYDGRAVERVSSGTVGKMMTALQAVMGWAVRNGFAEQNPCLGMRPKTEARIERLPFGARDLTLIFSSPVFTGCRSARDRFAPGDLVIRDALYWIPWIALWTGARLEEIGQLALADIKRDDEVDYFDFNDFGEGKSVKTRTSVRKVPIHRELIRLGFLDHVADLRRSGEIQLFPELRVVRFGKRTAAFSKVWGRLLTTLGIDDQGKTFHSFRHAFKDSCREAGLREDVHDALTGHAGGGVGRRYGAGHSLRRLAEAVDRVAYAGVGPQKP
ncbi:MAG: site-specific integrase [Alphaproteobacteria bacterium]|nr:site-specific integrase [Alphaproteobacteria bacterium]